MKSAVCLLAIGACAAGSAEAGPLFPPTTQLDECAISEAGLAYALAGNCLPLSGGIMSGPNYDQWANNGGLLYVHTNNQEAVAPAPGTLSMSGTLAAGGCLAASVPMTGVTTTSVLAVTPQGYPGDAFDLPVAVVSTNGTTTLHICNRSAASGTLTSQIFMITPMPGPNP